MPITGAVDRRKELLLHRIGIVKVPQTGPDALGGPEHVDDHAAAHQRPGQVPDARERLRCEGPGSIAALIEQFAPQSFNHAFAVHHAVLDTYRQVVEASR
jgi:hypothetical protein